MTKPRINNHLFISGSSFYPKELFPQTFSGLPAPKTGSQFKARDGEWGRGKGIGKERKGDRA
jgi:hypothetical protein